MRRRRVSQKPFLEAPFMIIWELACPPKTDWGSSQDEDQTNMRKKILSLEEKKEIIDQIRDFGEIKLIFSGGDLFKEKDFLELVSYASSKGLKVSARPTLTSSITKKSLIDFQQAGAYIAIDLHGPDKDSHDNINGSGSFDLTMKTINYVVNLGIPLQINTALSTKNYEFIKPLADKIRLYPLVLWNIALILASEKEIPSASDCELLYQWLYDYSKTVPFDIKTTSGQQFHRVIIQNKRRENKISGNYIHFRDALLNGIDGVKGGIERAPYGINDGKGMLFISYDGYVYPSSMLPIKIGHVREDSLQDIYRDASILKKIKNADLLKGKCGLCEYRNVCGGSRARAYLLTGDYLEADPNCLYSPPKLYKEEKRNQSIIIHE